MEDSNRNSIPRSIMREGTPPTFLTNEQSRSLPRGMPLFSTPEQGKISLKWGGGVGIQLSFDITNENKI